jgi:hypothetical protein
MDNLRLPKDSPVTSRDFFQVGFAVVFFAFAYMIPGTAGRTLPLLSDFNASHSALS